MSKLTLTIIFITVPLSMNAFRIGKYTEEEMNKYKKHIQMHLPESDILKLEYALATDPFFSGLKKDKILGAGTFGLVFKMSKMTAQGEKSYAIKIGNSDFFIQAKRPFDESVLQTDGAELNAWIVGERFVEVLRNKQTPYLPLLYAVRSVVFKDDVPSRNKQQDVPIHKLIQASEIAEYGDMSSFGVEIKTETLEKKLNVFHTLFLKSALSLAKINENNVIHGDIKPDNFFIKKCNDFGEQYCPIVGDWDLAYQINPEADKTESQMRYTLLYRPIEMLYFTSEDGQEVKRGSFGYKFSGKEDVYALGISMLEFLFKMGVAIGDLNPIIKETLAKMIHPMPLSDVPNLFEGEALARLKWIKEFVKDKLKWFDKTYLQDRARFDGLCMTAIHFHNFNNEVIETVQDIALNQKYRLFTYYELIKSDASTKQIEQLDYMEQGLDNDQLSEFYELYQKLGLRNPFQGQLDKRPTMQQVVEILFSNLINSESQDPIAVQINALYSQLPQNQVQSTETDPNRSDIVVLKSAYDTDYKNLQFFCVNAAYLEEEAGASYTPIVFGAIDKKMYSVNEWCFNINQRKNDLDQYRQNLQQIRLKQQKQIEAAKSDMFNIDSDNYIGSPPSRFMRQRQRKNKDKSYFATALQNQSQSNQGGLGQNTVKTQMFIV